MSAASAQSRHGDSPCRLHGRLGLGFSTADRSLRTADEADWPRAGADATEYADGAKEMSEAVSSSHSLRRSRRCASFASSRSSEASSLRSIMRSSCSFCRERIRPPQPGGGDGSARLSSTSALAVIGPMSLAARDGKAETAANRAAVSLAAGRAPPIDDAAPLEGCDGFILRGILGGGSRLAGCASALTATSAPAGPGVVSTPLAGSAVVVATPDALRARSAP
mmetsp:Transcript_47209/g.156476  ORF Transcript_47209/g.156476 Transcript_47209/m.156476 type:complete len:223 (+) Transcript_47209:747-1415(+)